MFRWIREMKEKTATIDKEERVSYIAEYYWYHILLTFLAFFLLCLLVYHVTLGRQSIELTVSIVNEETDDERDETLSQLLAELTGIEAGEISVDSNYKVAYNATSETDYTGYDKFFFGWSQGELDVVVMPTSFLEYCIDLGGELRTINENGSVSIALANTIFATQIEDNEEDPLVVVFPSNGQHETAAESVMENLVNGEVS